MLIWRGAGVGLMQNKTIWLLGGSGSGKSTAANIFADIGLKIVDADKISRKIMEKGKKAYLETVKAFGKEILMPDSSINRRKLGELVFSDGDKLCILNNITHKYIKEELLMNLGQGVTVIDAALPPDGFLNPSYIVAIIADREKRLKRIIKRDSISMDQAQNRIASQMSDAEYKKMADVVFLNNDTDIELKILIEKWCKDEKII